MPDNTSSDTGVKLIPPNDTFAGKAHCPSFEKYEEMYQRSITDPEGFWGDIADTFVWEKKWDKVCDYSFEGDVHIKWFINGKTNISVNALDRHLETRGDQVAIIWEGNEPGEQIQLTYKDLHAQVCKFANALKSLGIEKGDRVCLYMQMIPELPVAMLACARIGAIHSVVFGAFSEDSLRDRIQDSECKILITQDTALRGKKNDIEMKAKADKAVAHCPSIENVVVVQRTGIEVPMQAGRDRWWHELMDAAEAKCDPVWLDAEDPLFILYTSGSTGKPKGVLHTTGGYMIYTTTTFSYIFDYQDGDVWWCTADIGWITGHSYIVYGPLCAGATSVMFEGVPTYPDAGRFWDVVDKYKVTQFYTAPTAIRALMRCGEEPVKSRDLSSLKLLGSVGEPINPEVWLWYWRTIGKERCPVVDTWWQTETGGILITPLPGAHTLKPGSAQPAILWGGADHRGRSGQARATWQFRQALYQEAMAWDHADHVGRPSKVHPDLFQRLQRAVLLRRWLPSRRRRRLLAARASGRRDQRIGTPLGDGRSGKRSGQPRIRGGSGGRGLPTRHQGTGHIRLCHVASRL